MSQKRRTRRIIPPVRRWYRRHGRVLPWRGTHDAYRILLSEIMLQQTQVHRVLEKYPSFLKRFPSLNSLARAPRRAVLLAWRGMGYNRRAVHLHNLARTLVERWRGNVPSDVESLMGLPGIGRYTAHALLSSVHAQRLPIVDVNVRRFLSRVFWPMSSTQSTKAEEEIWRVAGEILPSRSVYAWNQALMDIGATVCRARAPECTRCPVSGFCRSRRTMKQRSLARRQTERHRKGIPDRIYRGRIVEMLRGRGGRVVVTAAHLGRNIDPTYSPRDQAWLRQLLEKLAHEGIVRLHGQKRGAGLRISLA